MRTLEYTLDRGDESFDLQLSFSMTRCYPGKYYGPPEHCYPAECGDITSLTAYHNGEEFKLTPEEEQKAMDFIMERHEHD